MSVDYLDEALPPVIGRAVVLFAMLAVGGLCYLWGYSNSPGDMLRRECRAAVASFDRFRAQLDSAYMDELAIAEQQRLIIVGGMVACDMEEAGR